MKQKMGMWSLAAAVAAWIILVVNMRCWGAVNMPYMMMKASAIGGSVIPLILGLASIILGIVTLVKKRGYLVAAIVGISLALMPALCGGYLIYVMYIEVY